jgi:2-furoate---CoA ligase
MFDVGQGFLASVARNPGALAIVEGARRLNYGEWADEIRRVAAGLGALGLNKGDHLVTVLQNRLDAATLHWACQITGIIITPLNWRATAAELDSLLADADARAVAFEAAIAGIVADAPFARGIARLAVGDTASDAVDDTTGDAVGNATGDAVGDHHFDDLRICDPLQTLPALKASDTSLMLYTSGTTGRAKGVPRSHGAERAAALAHVAQNLYQFGECTLGVMPLYHTMGVRSLLAMAAINGCFVCLPRFNAGQALSLIAREQVSALYLVPTLYHDLLADPGFAAADITSVTKLGYAGATMTDGLLARLDKAFRPDLFVNHYGSSEIYTFTVEQDAAGKPGSAGKAGLNQEIRVIALDSADPNDRVAPGTEGQIAARLDGDESFAGYWRRPDADKKALRRGWYLTGDIGYFDADGDLFVTGRVDDMIITGGENVSPVEVESVLSLHPGVGEVAVVGLADPRWGQKVTAFVTRAGTVDAKTLDEFCRASDLANFKRPRDYVFIAAIPKSPVGKILRRLLVAGEYETA